MGVASPALAWTNFDLTHKVPPGLSDLRVVCNGIPSAPVTVNIE